VVAARVGEGSASPVAAARADEDYGRGSLDLKSRVDRECRWSC